MFLCLADLPFYTSNRNIATCSADTTIKIWSANNSTPATGGKGTVDASSAYTLDKVLQGHQRWVWDMAYSADSAYLVSGKSRKVSLMEPSWAGEGRADRIILADSNSFL